ncbi:MAG: site-specific integrase [Tissierellia bacterium]|nr:site-specific integrase [Tissierellia bacterium]
MEYKNLNELFLAFEEELKRVSYSGARIRDFRRYMRELSTFAQETGVDCFSRQLTKDFLSQKYPVDYGYKLIGSYPKPTRHAHRTMDLLLDFDLHGIIRGRTCARYNHPISEEVEKLVFEFSDYNRQNGISESSISRFNNELKKFMRYLSNNNIALNELSENTILSYLGIHIDQHRDTLRKDTRALRKFLVFFYEKGYTKEDLSKDVPPLKSLYHHRIPPVWDADDVKKILAAIDRGNPTGKRNYAILMLVTKTGIRSEDVRNLRFFNLNWDDKKIEFTQSKTKNPISLPLLPDVGWAIIDYLKNGRPKSETDYIFLTHNAPITRLSSETSMSNIIAKYAEIAGVDLNEKMHHGLHSLRHSLASRLLEVKTPLPVISEILGHATPHEVKVYLNTDIEKLRLCALNPEEVLSYDKAV